MCSVLCLVQEKEIGYMVNVKIGITKFTFSTRILLKNGFKFKLILNNTFISLKLVQILYKLGYATFFTCNCCFFLAKIVIYRFL